MSNLVGQTWSALGDALSVPLLLGAALAVLIALMRAVSSLRFAVRQRGGRPLVVQVDYGKAGQDDDRGDSAFDARLLSYLAVDGHGSYVIAPGAGGPAAPGVPAEAAQPSAALLRLAMAREPAYRVDVTWPTQTASGACLRGTVRITRTPTDRIVASRSFTEQSMDDLIEIIGCFCITFLRSQTKILRQSPRWERWSLDIEGYRAYRRGLDHQRLAEATSSTNEYRLALSHFDQAAGIEPANMLVQLHRAALLELENEHLAAVAIYKKCRTLWPEHIEVAYRLGNAHKSIQDHVTFAELNRPLQDIRAQLAYSRLLARWLRSSLPHRWNPGERRYWGSWLRPSLPGGVSKRTTYINAISVSELLAELSSLLKRPYDDPSRWQKRATTGNVPSASFGSNATGTEPNKKALDERNSLEFNAMLVELARTVSQRRIAFGVPRSRNDEQTERQAIARLLWPESHHSGAGQPCGASHRQGSYPDNGSIEVPSDYSYIPTYHGRSRYNPGWLALFNTACFLSLAMNLPDNYIPPYAPCRKLWSDYCALAAIRQLGIILRHPEHVLDPDWLRTDPDLGPLRDSAVGREWAAFIGLIRT
jgi:tetratricopeptide (TPR) repeat protein